MPALVVIALSMAGAAGQLRVHTSSTRMPSSLIVGRAVCSHGTWLLTEHRDLILVTHPARQVTVQRLEGLRTNDRLWGLACLTDGTLWLLAMPCVLIRIGAEGVVRERVGLRFLAWPCSAGRFACCSSTCLCSSRGLYCPRLFRSRGSVRR